MFGSAPTARGLMLMAAGAGLILAISCSSNNNKSNNNAPAGNTATKAASGATTAPAGGGAASATTAATRAASPAPAAAGGSPAAGGAVAMTFQPPGGTAPWSNTAAGCHAVKAPAGADAAKASDTGISTTELKIGTNQPLSGPAASYAPIIKTMQACFNQINAEGGIYGRKINLEILDDAYNPAQTVPLTKKMVEEDKIWFDLFPLGTPTDSAVVDYLNEQKVPMIYVGSGAAKWAATPDKYPWTYGFQPDYPTEGEAYARYIQQTPELKGKKVGILRQNDDFGADYMAGFKKVLGDKGTSDNPIVDEETYETSATDVTSQITNLKGKGADIFILIAVPTFSGKALKAAADQGWKPTIIMTSVSVDPTLPGLAGGPQNVAGVISDAYYHTANENDPSLTEVKDFLSKNASDVQFANFPIFGYMLGQLTVETLKRAGVNPTRQSLVDAVASFQKYTIPQLLQGISVDTSKTDHRPIKCIHLLKFGADGTTSYFGNNICASPGS